MTAFVTSDIPTSINTLEKLATWVGLALQRCNPNTTVLEAPGLNPERVASVILFKADDNSTRLGIRLSLQVADGYAENPQKFWTNVVELPQSATLPAAFKTN